MNARRSAFLIKIVPPGGYDVYRLHVPRWVAGATVVLVVAAVLAALGIHAWQLHAAEESVRALQAEAHARSQQLGAIDREADQLAGQLRALQRENAEIRHLLGGGSAAPQPRPTHAFDPHPGPATMSQVQERLKRLAAASAATRSDEQRLVRLTHRVLNLRRLAVIARQRMIAALPSINPVGGGIASAYGWRTNPWPEFHRGVDLEGDYGTPVRAAASGTVVYAAWEGGFGNKVEIDHGNGYATWYAHLAKVEVAVGAHVGKGDEVAQVGATGEATGPHLHYQVMYAGKDIDPTPFLTGVPKQALATLPDPARVQ